MRKILRSGFSMIELIFVIIVLGIVSSIGAEIIANVYEGYIIQRAQHRASIKTELAAVQIANRLAYAIPGTVVRKSALDDATPTDINVPGATEDNILQWVGSDADSFKSIDNTAAVTRRRPGWNGFCDVDNSALGGTSISTPGSNLNLASTIITNLGGNIDNAAIFYEYNNTLQRRGIAAAGTAGETITLDGTVNSISEHYKLAWTSYALEARANGDLILHYNVIPQRGIAVAGSSEILLRNVSTFEFTGDGRTIRFKICTREDLGDGLAQGIAICKEKAVF
jgi:prepilin-type N-terminal cleavage/methylation domain-containing protein